MINLFDLTQQQLKEWMVSLGEKPYRGTQIIQWLYQYHVNDFEGMTNLPAKLRERLSKEAILQLPSIKEVYRSQDDTLKFLIELLDGRLIETVYIPEPEYGTLCISSQVGCPLGCSFCATGQMGFQRNLTPSEIIGQLWLVNHYLGAKNPRVVRAVRNVVLMGMGEPLLNVEAVITAITNMLDDHAYGLAKRRVTVSTSGIFPGMQRLKESGLDVSLAISLHATRDTLRTQLMPINKTYPMKELLALCKTFFEDPGRTVTFEYILMEGVNDTVEMAKECVRLLKGIPAKVNLIPFNSTSHSSFKAPSQETIDAFRRVFLEVGISTITRRTRGRDINAACGQLVVHALQSEVHAETSMESAIPNANGFSGLAQIDSSSLGIPLGGEEQASGVYKDIHEQCERRCQQRGKPKCEEYMNKEYPDV